MERTRDVSPKSIAGSDIRSVASTSTSSQSSDKKSLNDNRVDNQSALVPHIQEAINETIAEKNTRAKEITELLNVLDIDPKSMPKDIQDLWTKVATIMRAEGLSDMDEVTLTLHMQRKNREALKKGREERKLKKRFNSLQERQAIVQERSAKAQESLVSLQKLVDDEANNEDEHVNRMVKAIKLNDYKEVMDKTEATIIELGVSDSFPEQILEKYKTYLELQEELKDAEEKLSKYYDLPPNLSEARVKLAEKERYLKDLEHEIFEKMK